MSTDRPFRPGDIVTSQPATGDRRKFVVVREEADDLVRLLPFDDALDDDALPGASLSLVARAEAPPME